jgi:Exotoxin A catalytic
MENCFSTDTWRSKLTDKPDSLKSSVEEFLKQGLEPWKKGKIKPPEEFQRLLLGEAQQSVQSSSRKLIEWQQDSEQVSKQQRKIFPDEDAEFLSCGHGARRRKRGTEMSSGVITVPSKKEFLETHKNIIDDGYVLIGYHGTSGEAATFIMAGNLKPTDSFSETPHWNGVYVANDVEMALGYALGDKPRVLAVYARKQDIKNTALTHEDINHQFDVGGRGYPTNKEPSSSIVSGQESGFGLNEIIVKKGINLKTAILPIDRNGIEELDSFFKRQKSANDLIKESDRLPFLDEIKAGEDLNSIDISQKSKNIINSFIETKSHLSDNSIYKFFNVDSMDSVDVAYLKKHF